MINVAIFASGSGTNAAAIIRHFSKSSSIKVSLIVSSKSNAGVLSIAEANNIESLLINRKDFYETQVLLEELRSRNITFIILAGFLWFVPDYVLAAYSGKIVNIHPSLLPRHGGHGMYGMNVHKAVIESGDKETGITIHLVDEEYDRGEIVHQERIEVASDDTPETVAAKVQKLEHEHFPRVIENLINKMSNG